MKKNYAFLAIALIGGTFATTQAQVRWNPAAWNVVNPGNTTLVTDQDPRVVTVTPVSGKDHCHIQNAANMTLTADEPYLIIHFQATEGTRFHKNNTKFTLRHMLENFDNLTDEEKASYDGYVFEEAFTVDKNDGYVVLRTKYDDSDEDIFSTDWVYDTTTGRGNLWVIDLRKVPTKTGGYIFDDKTKTKVEITDCHSGYWRQVDGAPARVSSDLKIELCSNVIPSNTDKAFFLADKYVHYRYIATASAIDICKDATSATENVKSRAVTDEIDPTKVKTLIDNYHTNASASNNYDEAAIRTDATTGVDNVNAEVENYIYVAGNIVSCPDAAVIELYNLTGSLVASANGDQLEAAAGLYIARATTSNGKVITSKIIIK